MGSWLKAYVPLPKKERGLGTEIQTAVSDILRLVIWRERSHVGEVLGLGFGRPLELLCVYTLFCRPVASRLRPCWTLRSLIIYRSTDTHIYWNEASNKHAIRRISLSLLRNLSVGVGSHVQSEEKINRSHFLWHQWYDFTILHHFFQNFLSGGATYTTQWLSLDYIQGNKMYRQSRMSRSLGFPK